MPVTASTPAGKQRIVSVDIPDPDNFLMVLRVIKDFPDDDIKIVLSPRPVYFEAAPYTKSESGRLITAIKNARGIEGLDAPRKFRGQITEMDSSWIEKLGEEDRRWFYVDPDFSNPQVARDSALYLELSAVRLIEYLQKYNVRLNRYELYVDSRTISRNKIGVATRHAAHSPDFAYGSSGLMKVYTNAVAKNVDEHGATIETQCTSLGEAVREACDRWVSIKCDTLSLNRHALFKSFSKLASENARAGTKVEIYVGGPLTETVAYIESGAPVDRIVAMGGFIDGRGNLFENQFNFLADMKAAIALLERAQKEPKGWLTLLPTEVAKSSYYSLTREELEQVVGKSSPTMQLYNQWDSNAHEFYLFDMVAAMVVSKPHLFTTKQVKLDLTSTPGTIRFKVGSDEDPITMCWNEVEWDPEAKSGNGALNCRKDEHMRQNRPKFLEALKETFEST